VSWYLALNQSSRSCQRVVRPRASHSEPRYVTSNYFAVI